MRTSCSRTRRWQRLLVGFSLLGISLVFASCAESVSSPSRFSAPTITTASLPAAEVGVEYSHSMSASGGDGDYQWSLGSGAPEWLSITSLGLLSGTPSQPGEVTFEIQVESDALTTTESFTLEIRYAQPAISETALAPGVFGQTYVDTLTATGGDGVYAWGVAGGALPSGVTLSGEGILRGTPGEQGAFDVTFEVESAGLTTTATKTLTVTLPPVTVETDSLPQAFVGLDYNATLRATGGTGTFVWSISSGTLPSGLALADSGRISGTPTEAVTTELSFVATSGSESGSKALTLRVTEDLAVTTDSLPAAAVGTSYSQQLGAAGGDGNYSWALTSGSLPSGITLADSGLLSGTPSSSGISTFGVRVVSAGDTAVATFDLEVQEPVVITTESLPVGYPDTPYEAILEATGGSGEYAWGITSGTLPAGLNLSNSGVISGTPQAPDSAQIVVEATSGPQSVTQTLLLVISGELVVATESLPTAVIDEPYSATLESAGGDSNDQWSITAGRLPTGLTLTVDGLISGTPTVVETTTFTVLVQNSGQTASAELSLTVTTPVAFVTDQLSSGLIYAPYSDTLEASGGDGTYSWSVTGGQLPAGLALQPEGVIDGIPSETGDFVVTVQVQSLGRQASRTFDLRINSDLAITSGLLAEAVTGQSYSAQLYAGGGDGQYTWLLMADTLPAGLSLSSDGLISGTPDASGLVKDTVRFSVTATSAGATDSAQITLPLSAANMDDAVFLASEDGASCVVREGGDVACWWQTGTYDTLTNAVYPRPISAGGAVFSNVEVWGSEACGVSDAGEVWCWGSEQTTASRLNAVRKGGLPGGIEDVSIGGDHKCALSSAGVAYCWGQNYAGQLGDGSTVYSDTPVRVDFDGQFASLTNAGGNTQCGLTDTGEIHCWGSNGWALLGRGLTYDELPYDSVPGPVTGSWSYSEVEGTGGGFCSLRTGGELDCWGVPYAWGDTPQAPPGAVSFALTAPTRIGGNRTFSALAQTPGVSEFASDWCALESASSLVCLRSRTSYDQLPWYAALDEVTTEGFGTQPAPPAGPVQQADLFIYWSDSDLDWAQCYLGIDKKVYCRGFGNLARGKYSFGSADYDPLEWVPILTTIEP